MKIRISLINVLIGTVLVIFLNHCTAEGDNNPQPQPQNPIPVLTTISPTSMIAHLPPFTLTATGSDFVSGSRIVFNGVEKATNFVSATELNCQIDPEDIRGSAALIQSAAEATGVTTEDVLVLVRSPSPGGGDSNTVDFEIRSGHTFSAASNVSGTAGLSGNPDMAVDVNDRIHLSWHDYTPGNAEIFYRRSGDGGSTWNQTKNISATNRDSRLPAIAVDSGDRVYVAWYDYVGGKFDVYLNHAGSGGTAWGQIRNVSNAAVNGYRPTIKVDGEGNVNVTWFESMSFTNRDIFFSRSGDQGATWSAKINISKNSDISANPYVAVDSSGGIYIVWHDRSAGNTEIFFSHSSDGGTSWSAGRNITHNAGKSLDPQMAIDEAGNLNVTWYDYSPGNAEVFFSRSTDGGATWSTAKNVSNTIGNSHVPALAMDRAGNLNVVWYDDSPGNLDIYFSRSIDNGKTWSAAVNLSNSSGDSYCPCIVVDSAGYVGAAWHDFSGGNADILFSGTVR